MRILISVLVVLCCSTPVLAGTAYKCTRGDRVRTIEVVYLGPGPVPCEVRYTKNGAAEVLWRAQAEQGYCEARAAEFVEKQRTWGWTCHDPIPAEQPSE